MALQSGYTKLEYIQSSGTQYIDTGVLPDNNTKVIADFECISGTSDPTVFGAWNGWVSKSFIFLALSSRDSGHGFFGSQFVSYTKDMTSRHIITADKNSWSLDGSSLISFNSETFSCSVPIFLFAYNNNGSAGNIDSSIKIYSCKIYDGGTLVRDFVPAKDGSGVAGMYDLVTGSFYTNAGSGTFTAGELPKVHKTMVDGTLVDIKSARCMAGGTSSDIEVGTCLVDGTICEISLVEKISVKISINLYGEWAKYHPDADRCSATIDGVTYYKPPTDGLFNEAFTISVKKGSQASFRSYTSSKVDGDGIFLNGKFVAGSEYSMVLTENTSIAMRYQAEENYNSYNYAIVKIVHPYTG